MAAYRWNTSDFAAGYDAAAQIIHPHYLAIQDAILDLLPASLNNGGLVIDLGGGSGRLVERILDKFPLASALIIDQSEPFLALAERRLTRFGPRATCHLARLQDDWVTLVIRRFADHSPAPAPAPDLNPSPNLHLAPTHTPSPAPSGPATAIVSMSAIHHLEPAEKQTLYRRCHDLLTPSGLLLNGDEIRADDDTTYFSTLTTWADYMRTHMASGAIPAPFHPALLGWIDRNVTRFGQEKKSGDDIHETVRSQLAYFRSAGFTTADSPWQTSLWAILRGIK